jgi:hypothetical protein
MVNLSRPIVPDGVRFAAPLDAWLGALFSQRESARKPPSIADCQTHPDSGPIPGA